MRGLLSSCSGGLLPNAPAALVPDQSKHQFCKPTNATNNTTVAACCGCTAYENQHGKQNKLKCLVKRCTHLRSSLERSSNTTRSKRLSDSVCSSLWQRSLELGGQRTLQSLDEQHRQTDTFSKGKAGPMGQDARVWAAQQSAIILYILPT